MAGPQIPTTLGQVQTAPTRGGGTTYTAPGVGELGTINPPPAQTEFEKATRERDYAERMYNALMDEDIEERIRKMAPQMGWEPPYGEIERRQAEQALNRDRNQWRQALSTAERRVNEVQKDTDKTGKQEALHEVTITDPQTGQPRTVRLNDTQYAAWAEREQRGDNTLVPHPDGSGQMVPVAVANYHRSLQKDQPRLMPLQIGDQTYMVTPEEGRVYLTQYNQRLAEKAKQLEAEGRSAKQIVDETKLELMAINKAWENLFKWETQNYTLPFRQIQTMANQRYISSVQDLASQRTNDRGLYKIDADNEVKQRNKDVEEALKVVDKVLEVYANRMKALGAPGEVMENDINSMRRYANTRLKSGGTAGREGYEAWRQEQSGGGKQKAVEDPFGWGDQVPVDPHRYGLNRASEIYDWAEQRRVGPGYPQRPPERSMPRPPAILGQLPESQIGPAPQPMELLNTLPRNMQRQIIAGAHELYPGEDLSLTDPYQYDASMPIPPPEFYDPYREEDEDY